MAQQLSSTVYVGNVESNVDEFTINSIFQNCGTVTNVRLAGKPGYNTMYCFVEYADPSMAQCALALDGLQLGSRQIKVSVARSPTNPPGGGMGGGGMGGGPGGPRSMHAVAAAAAAAAAYGGPPGGIVGGGRGGYGMHGGGFHPHHGGGGHHLGGGGHQQQRGNNHDPVRVAKTIFVDGVPLSVSEETLATFFSMCGAVYAVRLTPPAPSGESRRAWVEFESLESARLALQYDSTVMGGSTLRVSASRSQIHTNGLREMVAPPEGVPLGLPRPPAADGGEGGAKAGEDEAAAAAKAAAAAAAASITVPAGDDEKGDAGAASKGGDDAPAKGDGDEGADAGDAAAAASTGDKAQVDSPSASKRDRDSAESAEDDADKRARVNADGTPASAD